MGWKDNRRRKRTWYRHYAEVARRLAALMNNAEFCPEAILQIFFDIYESRRMHGKAFIAESAYESLRLACQDAGLTSKSLEPKSYVVGWNGVGDVRAERPTNIPGQLRPPPEDREVRTGPQSSAPPEQFPELPPSAIAVLVGQESETADEL